MYRHPPARLILAIDVRQRLSVGVADAEAFGRLMTVLGGWKQRRSAITFGPQQGETHEAPGITRSNTNPKNGERLFISGAPSARPSLDAPIFFRLALHGRRRRVLDLDPMIDSA